MNRSETVQNIRRMMFTDLIAEVDEMLAESNDAELAELHEALALDPGNRVLEKLEALKASRDAQTKPEAAPAKPEAEATKAPAAKQQKEMKW